MLLTIPKSLETDIINFVKANDIEDINNFLVSCLRDGYNIIKYGTSPKDNFKSENKPLKIKEYETNTEKCNVEGVETEQKKRVGRPKKHTSTSSREKDSKPIEKEEEPIKPKKKIQIIKN